MFSTPGTNYQPLADRVRPRELKELVGQQHLLGEGKPLRRLLESGQVYSMVLWGPPGTGKTTLARLVARYAKAQFLTLSAVMAGVKDIRESVAKAKEHRETVGRDTVLFIDEVHRFNKAQQDAFLPNVEDGTVKFIGATTENPSFELNNALLSRTRVYILKPLDADDIRKVIDNALSDHERGLGNLRLEMSKELREVLARAADGDARRALNALEMSAELAEIEGTGRNITRDLLLEVLSGGGPRRFDKRGDTFYDEISALHKAIRGSKPDAALYWLARMLDGGCDPLYVARRLVRAASEDIGNADPRALQLALNAWDTQQRLGSPEGELALAQAAVYLACASKSNAVYKAFGAANVDVRALGSLDVPLHLRNSPTRLTKELGHGKRYRYAHDEPDAYAAGETYFPEGMNERQYYFPTSRGLEARIAERLAYFRALDGEYQKKVGQEPS